MTATALSNNGSPALPFLSSVDCFIEGQTGSDTLEFNRSNRSAALLRLRANPPPFAPVCS